MKLNSNQFFIILVNIFLCNSANLRAKNTLTQENFYSSDQYESPHIIHHETPNYVEHNHDEMTDDHYIPQGHFIHVNNHYNQIQKIDDCLCSIQVRCHPCEEIVTRHFPIDCPCAPKLNCPICPPLSLIHEIAAKKVRLLNI